MYDANPSWDKEDIKKIARKVGLKESQIYKWNWDMRKKNNLIEVRKDEDELDCDMEWKEGRSTEKRERILGIQKM